MCERPSRSVPSTLGPLHRVCSANASATRCASEDVFGRFCSKTAERTSTRARSTGAVFQDSSAPTLSSAVFRRASLRGVPRAAPSAIRMPIS